MTTIAIGIMLISSITNAQQNLIKVSVNFQGFTDQIIGGTYLGFGADFEYAKSNNFTIELDAQHYRRYNDHNGVYDIDIRNIFNIQPQVRWHLGEVFRGLHLGAHYSVNLFDTD